MQLCRLPTELSAAFSREDFLWCCRSFALGTVRNSVLPREVFRARGCGPYRRTAAKCGAGQASEGQDTLFLRPGP